MKKKLTKLRFTDSDNDYQITMWQEEVRLGGGGLRNCTVLVRVKTMCMTKVIAGLRQCHDLGNSR